MMVTAGDGSLAYAIWETDGYAMNGSCASGEFITPLFEHMKKK